VRSVVRILVSNRIMRLRRALIVPGLLAIAVTTAFAQVTTYTGSARQPPQRPTGVITGFIVDETGAPVARVMVQAFSEIVLGDGTKMPMTRSSPPTDDTGRFRIDNLPAQRFLVAVMPPPSRAFNPRGMPAAAEQPVYTLTYYPGVINRADAQPVVVADNSEQTIFVELRRVQPMHVRGSVSSTSGRSTAGLQVTLQQSFGGGSFSRMGNVVGSDGSFDVGGVGPGSYTVIVRVSMEQGAEFAAQDVEVTDRDVDDVRLTLGVGGTLVGRIVFDGPPPGPAPLGANISLGPMPGGIMVVRPSFGPVPVAEDWTFRVNGLYGSYRIGIPSVLLGPYRPVRFDFDGRTLPPGNTSIEIRDGEHQLIMYFASAARR
jgi:hypothetical protein